MKKGHKDLWYNTKFDIRVKGDLVQRIRKHKPNLGDVLLAVQSNGKRLDVIENRLGKVEKDVHEVKKDVHEVKDRLGKVEKDVHEVKKDVHEVKNRLSKVESRIDNIVIRNNLVE